ncbi:long-chain fatty acid--CoA ligase [Metapseudomonas lalkuanensis]|uniref:Long-chain fatty acid--CoA ligase n=1 Tax=Metapseudomonas lalkuanensis TaxID=2604832 RepID=A0A5J6QQT6_9GAMM|nr:AMP-binding protein [Pseudomonas lalkuanensis]QEY63046.1 long-chain fatty acid--CoA ligase [Pseudomonas lalkuanensis]
MKAVLSSLSEQAAKRFADQTALIVGEKELSFNEIDSLAARFAGGLRKNGVQRGQVVILHLPNGWEWIVSYYAIARLGAVVVPANFLLSIEEIAYITANSGAIAVIAPRDRCEALTQTLADAGAREPDLVIALSPVAVAAQETIAYLDFDSLLREVAVPPVEVEPDDLFTIAYTSGTTGNPKGAMLTHRNVFMSTALTATVHVRCPGERVVSALPFPHVYGNVVMNACFLVGMTLISTERFDADWALQSIERYKATLFEGVPTMFYYMLTHPSLSHTDLRSLTRCTVGGQTMPVAKIEAITKVLGCPLLELWGMTEVAGPVISHSPYLPARHGAIGLPFPGVEMKIVTTDDSSRTLGIGESGELVVRGPTVMRGYLGNAEATSSSLLEGGWLRTGDVAQIDAEGYVHILDRLKDMIITAGYKIFPAELEQVLASHPAVAMVAVAPVKDDLKGELAKAFIVLDPGLRATEGEILEYCRKHLASYKVPRSVAFVDSLPRTSTGKILRRELRS